MLHFTLVATNFVQKLKKIIISKKVLKFADIVIEDKLFCLCFMMKTAWVCHMPREEKSFSHDNCYSFGLRATKSVNSRIDKLANSNYPYQSRESKAAPICRPTTPTAFMERHILNRNLLSPSLSPNEFLTKPKIIADLTSSQSNSPIQKRKLGYSNDSFKTIQNTRIDLYRSEQEETENLLQPIKKELRKRKSNAKTTLISNAFNKFSHL